MIILRVMSFIKDQTLESEITDFIKCIIIKVFSATTINRMILFH